MIFFLVLALAAGVLLPVQAGLNAQLRSALGSPIAAAFISFLVGTAALAAVALVFRVSFPVQSGMGGDSPSAVERWHHRSVCTCSLPSFWRRSSVPEHSWPLWWLDR